MPRFYFHLYDDMDVIDKEGAELPDAAAAFRHALKEARTMACASIHQGHLNLNHRIEIEDEAGDRTLLEFRDAFVIIDD